MRAIPFCISVASLCFGPLNGAFSIEGSGSLPKIIQLGESAYKKGDLRTAREAYKEAIELGGKNAPSARNYFERSLRLAEIENALGNQKAAFHLLTDISRDSDIPPDLYIKVETFRAKLLAESDRAGAAYVLLTKAKERLPVDMWKKGDKAYFMSLEFILEEHYADILARAERFSISGLYDQAYPLYKGVWQDMDEGFVPKARVLEGKDFVDKVRYLYAEASYHTSPPQEALTLLGPLLEEIKQDPKYGSVTDLSTLYLASQCYRQLNAKEELLDTLESYLTMSKSNPNANHHNEVIWELGVTYFERGRLQEAEELFIDLKASAPSENLHISSELYLARINMARDEHYEANQRLRRLSQNVSSKDPLKYELAYLLGEIAYQKKQYTNALNFFEKAIPARNTEQARWYPSLLKKQAFSYLRLAEEESSTDAKESHFRQAERILMGLTELHGETALGVLELSRAYLNHANALDKSKYYAKVESLLADDHYDFSDEQAGEALLLRAEASDSFAHRESLFRTIFEDSRFEGTFVRKKAFFYQGVNHMMHAKEELPSEAKRFWEQSDRYFSFAIEELGNDKQDFYAQALKLRAEARYNLGSRQHLIEALKDLQLLFEGDQKLITHVDDAGEVYHMQGLIGAKLYRSTPSSAIVNMAKQSLSKVVNSYDKAPYAAEALYTLGALNYLIQDYKEAYSSFSRYIRNYPRADDIDFALFWSAEAASKLDMSSQIVREIRNRLFDSHPESSLAPLAYLNYYSFSEYLSGSDAPLDHLREMYKQFPSSPFIVTAFYLLGLSEKKEYFSTGSVEHLNKALGYFQSSQDSFSHFQGAHAIPAEYFHQLTSIRYQSQLERAITFFLLSDDEAAAEKDQFEASVQGQKVLKNMIADFMDHQNMVTQAMLQENPYPKSLEEAQFTLAQSYLKEERPLEARKLFTQMLEQYQTARKSQGYYMSRSLNELGRMKMTQEKWEPALYYFNKSQEAAEGASLSQEQTLQLHVDKGLCFKELKDYTSAMDHLSVVIDANYPSDVRNRAMLIKAEILELTGHKDQAIRVLKASSQGNNEWSMRAKEKLKEYGFN